MRKSHHTALHLFQIILHSMHKYQPRVHVIRKDFSSDLSPNKPVPSGEGVKTFSFPETVFTTVTAYQNQQVLILFAHYSDAVLTFLNCRYANKTFCGNMLN